MGDFLPGYVQTLNSKEFSNLSDLIIIIDLDKGSIKGIYNTKEEFLVKAYNRNYRDQMICAYKSPVIFNTKETEQLWTRNIYPLSEKEITKIKDSTIAFQML